MSALNYLAVWQCEHECEAHKLAYSPMKHISATTESITTYTVVRKPGTLVKK